VNGTDGERAHFYFHPWEIDPGQPRVPGLGVRTRFRHSLNLARTERRLERLLSDFRWDRMDRVFLEGAAGPGRAAAARALPPAVARGPAGGGAAP
jgi:hypothetical protein